MAAAAGGPVPPPTFQRIVADPEECAVDWEWLVQLAKLLEEQPIVDQAAILGSFATLNSLLPPGQSIDVDGGLRPKIELRRQQWEAAGFFQARGVPDSLIDQVMMVHANTLQTPPVFKRMGEVMRNPNRKAAGGPSDQVLAMLPYVKALDSGLQALSHLPAFKYTGDAFRGMKYSYPNLLDRFPVGCEVFWYEPRSVTHSQLLMWDNEFCGTSGPRTIFVLSNVEGALIKELSEYQAEEEVLTRPLARFRVSGAVRQSGTGDPFTTADLVYMEMLPESCASCSLADTLVLAANDITAKAGLTTLKEQLPSERASSDFGARLALVGPTKSGKSTFANAFFKGVLVPSGKIPNTILPAVLLSDPGHASYSVELHGAGLQQALEGTVSGLKLDSLSIGDAADVLDRLNKAARDLAERGEFDLSDPEQFREWSFIVRLPGPKVGCAVVDCPGGNERGKAGEFIQLVLAFQVECAVAVAFIVAADNMVVLKDDFQLLECLGGPMTAQVARHSVVIVSKVSADDVEEYHEFLQNEEVRENLAKTLPGAKAPFLVSGQSLLTWGILQRMKSLPLWTDIAPDQQADVQYAFKSVYPKLKFGQEKYERERQHMWNDANDEFTRLDDNALVFDALRRALASWPSRLAASCLRKQQQGVEQALAQLRADVLQAEMSRTELEQRLEQCRGTVEASKLELLRCAVTEAAAPLLNDFQAKLGGVGDLLRGFAVGSLTWDAVHVKLQQQCGDGVAWAFRFTVPRSGCPDIMGAQMFLLSRALYIWVGEEARRSIGLMVGAAQQAAKDWVHQQLHISSTIEPGEYESFIPYSAPFWDYLTGIATVGLPVTHGVVVGVRAGLLWPVLFRSESDEPFNEDGASPPAWRVGEDGRVYTERERSAGYPFSSKPLNAAAALLDGKQLCRITRMIAKDLELAIKKCVSEEEQSLQERLSSIDARPAERLRARVRDVERTRDEVSSLLAVAMSASER